MKINNGLYLDAAEPHHWEGRAVNDGHRSGFETNARFGSALVANVCPVTGVHVHVYTCVCVCVCVRAKPNLNLTLCGAGRKWVPIIAKKK